MYKQITKYTNNTSYGDNLMSEKAEKHLTAYFEEMRKLMEEREEL